MTIERTSYEITKDKRGNPIKVDHDTTVLEPHHGEFVFPVHRIHTSPEIAPSAATRIGVFVRNDETLVFSPEGRPHDHSHSEEFTREEINRLEDKRHRYFREIRNGEITQRGVRFSWRPNSPDTT